jgi:hypothetical protein
MYILGLIVVSVVVLSMTGYLGKITGTAVEREVFEQSYQRSASLNSRMAAYQAQLAQINSKLMTETDTEIVNGLKAQKAMLEVQINTVKGQK